jgi:predicted phosphate transport protein (TIGR00153 family)
MLNKLIPTDKRFFSLFEKSAALLKQAAETLAESVQNPDRAGEYALRLERLEHDGDNLTHEIFILLDKSFITPIDREDIHELAQALDDCLDCIESVTERMQLYGLSEPTEPMKQFVEVIRKQAIEIHIVLPLISGFKYEKIIPHCKEINRLENVGDKLMRNALADLFRGDSDPLTVMKWKDIYDFLETTTDKCEDVAGIIERIVLKHG